MKNQSKEGNQHHNEDGYTDRKPNIADEVCDIIFLIRKFLIDRLHCTTGFKHVHGIKLYPVLHQFFVHFDDFPSEKQIDKKQGEKQSGNKVNKYLGHPFIT